MAYVIAEPCIGTKDNSCVEVCPVDCIHPTPDEPGYDAAEMLYIDPDECIDCDACVEACPGGRLLRRGPAARGVAEVHPDQRGVLRQQQVDAHACEGGGGDRPRAWWRAPTREAWGLRAPRRASRGLSELRPSAATCRPAGRSAAGGSRPPRRRWPPRRRSAPAAPAGPSRSGPVPPGGSPGRRGRRDPRAPAGAPLSACSRSGIVSGILPSSGTSQLVRELLAAALAEDRGSARPWGW